MSTVVGVFTTTATARARALVVMLAVVGIVVLQSVLCGATVSRPGCCPISGAHATSGSSAGTGAGAGAPEVHAPGDGHSDLEASPATAAGPAGYVVSLAPGPVDPGESGAVLGACLLLVIAVLAALAGLIGRDPYWTSWRRAAEPRPGGVPPIPAVRLDQLCVLRT